MMHHISPCHYNHKLENLFDVHDVLSQYQLQLDLNHTFLVPHLYPNFLGKTSYIFIIKSKSATAPNEYFPLKNLSF